MLPGMQSAFVDLGLERDAFLYVTDVIDPTEESLEEEEDQAPEPFPNLKACSTAMKPGACGRVGGVDAGAPAARACANPGQNGKRGRDRERTPSTTKIEDLLKEGQEVVVQVLGSRSAPGRAHHLAHFAAGAVPRLHADRQSHWRIAKDQSRDERRRCAASSRNSRKRPDCPAA